VSNGSAYEGPVPAGIGNCERCPFLETGTSLICYRCARETIEPLPGASRRCPVCDLPYESGESECRNPLCSWDDRYFDWNFAIAMRTGVLERALSRYKYEGRSGWRLIFGRVLVGFLDDHAATFDDFGLITYSPTFTGEGGRPFDHTWK
jgi:predicted amidophosphoribosyltransferase